MTRVTASQQVTLEQVRQLAEARLDDFDLTLTDPRMRASRPRLREIARSHKVLVDFLAGRKEHGSTAESLQKYFDQYAAAARRATSSAG